MQKAGQRTALLMILIKRAANVDIKDRLSDITVLKVGHHGSKYATSDKLLKTIKPQYALISCSIITGTGIPIVKRLKG